MAMKGLVAVKIKNGTDATVEASNLKNRQGNELPWRNICMWETKRPHTFGASVFPNSDQIADIDALRICADSGSRGSRPTRSNRWCRDGNSLNENG
jgi:hypothetical protein